MQKFKNFIKGFVATLIVILGVFLFNFYMTHSFGVMSLINGLGGFFILYPAIKGWESRLPW